MSLPSSLHDHLGRITGLTIHAVEPLPGGSINEAVRLRTSGGPLFLKWNRQAPPGMFAAEARGLELLRQAADGIRIPGLLHVSDSGPAAGSDETDSRLPSGSTSGMGSVGVGSEGVGSGGVRSEGMGSSDSGGPGGELRSDPAAGSDDSHPSEVPFLLMEYIEPSRGSRSDARRFGRQLATLHRTTTDQFGLDHDNYIGRLPQSNRQHRDWLEFFRAERIEPQLKQALDSGRVEPGLTEHWDRLAKQLPDLIPESAPALLHGDLWGGNYLFDEAGVAALIDPAVYYGHPEMELAFTTLFGGFTEAFYSGYAEVSPTEPGFQERIPIYNLYPLLVHVNLFGGHYIHQVGSILRNF